MNEQYSFCETIAAQVWHVRKLTAAGKKPGGGADSITLCGAKPSWDLKADPLNGDGQPSRQLLELRGICKHCRTELLRIAKERKGD